MSELAARHLIRSGVGTILVTNRTQERAEQMALDDYAWVPVYFMVTRDIVQPTVKGWIPNIKDFNRTRWLWIDRSAARP